MLFKSYEDRFNHWVGTIQARSDVEDWIRAEPALGGVDFESIRSGDHAVRRDEVLAALVRVAQSGDEIALLGILVLFAGRLSRSRWSHGPDVDEFEAVGQRMEGALLSALFQVVCIYPTRNRNRHVFANMTMDVRSILSANDHKNRRREARGHVVVQSGYCPTRSDSRPVVWGATMAEAGATSELADMLISYAHTAGRHNPDQVARMAFRRWVLGDRLGVIAAKEDMHNDTVRRQLLAFKEYLASSDNFVADLLVAA